MQFSPDIRAQVAGGTITVSYRLWSRPKVRIGGIYRSDPVWIEIDDIDLVPFSSVTSELGVYYFTRTGRGGMRIQRMEDECQQRVAGQTDVA